MTDDAVLADLLRPAGLSDDLGGVGRLLAGICGRPQLVPARCLARADRQRSARHRLSGSLACRRAALDGRQRRAPRPRCAAGPAARALRERGVDGFVLMRTDEHGSEYLPGYAERVAWLTGFTGSAAQAAVLMDRATVLSDGRYTVQLDQEVDRPCSSGAIRSTQPLSRLAGGASARRARGWVTIPGWPAGPSGTGWRPS